MSESMTNKNDFLRRLKTGKELYVLISACTKCPYVVCDPETFDDQVFLLFDAEEAKQEVQRLRGEGIPVAAAKLEQQQYLMFYTSLYTFGVNAILAKDKERKALIQLAEVVTRAEPKEEQGHVWVENPQLHLTALYLMQELRKSPAPSPSKELQDLQEEINAHFARGRYIQPVRKGEKEQGIPLLKMPRGDKFQPIFTDILEFEKFNRDKSLRPVVVPAGKIPDVLAPEAVGVVINPLGVNLPLKVTRRTQNAAPGQAAAGVRKGAPSQGPNGVQNAAPGQEGERTKNASPIQGSGGAAK